MQRIHRLGYWILSWEHVSHSGKERQNFFIQSLICNLWPFILMIRLLYIPLKITLFESIFSIILLAIYPTNGQRMFKALKQGHKLWNIKSELRSEWPEWANGISSWDLHSDVFMKKRTKLHCIRIQIHHSNPLDTLHSHPPQKYHSLAWKDNSTIMQTYSELSMWDMNRAVSLSCWLFSAMLRGDLSILSCWVAEAPNSNSLSATDTNSRLVA